MPKAQHNTMGRTRVIFRRNKTGVDVKTAHEMASDDGYVILDVRTAKERSQGHPPGSIHMALETIPDHLEELKGKKVLAFCRSGDRSGAAARFLTRHNIEAHNVNGGILAWSRAGLPLTKGPQP
ncbi:MAG: rhodanese-like domain-containing protein [Acidimicrobiia bacterium]